MSDKVPEFRTLYALIGAGSGAVEAVQQMDAKINELVPAGWRPENEPFVINAVLYQRMVRMIPATRTRT